MWIRGMMRQSLWRCFNLEDRIMKKTLLYSSLILVLGAIACNKTDEIVPKSDALISITTGINTKSFIGTQELLQTNATLHIMDIVSGDTQAYIDNDITYDATAEAWMFAGAQSYTWKSGDHKFFGWLTKDGSLTVSPTYTASSNTLSYSKALTTAAADQADFLYSDVIKRNPANAADRAAVDLQFSHLFSGIRISLTNSIGKQITVKSVSISGLKNSATGKITFGDPTETNAKGTSVSIDNLAESGSFIPATAPALTNQALADGGKIDVLSQSVLGADATAAAYMIWPQLMDGTAKVTVVYNTGEEGAADKTRVVDLAIPDGNNFKTMAAAYRYSFDLNIVSNDIQLTFVVADWDAKPTTITSEGGANITMSNVMWLHNRQVFYESAPNEADAIMDTYDDDEGVRHYGTATIFRSTAEGNPYVPVRAYFSIDYPTAGTYQIKLVRAYGATDDSQLQYFTLDNTGGDIVPGKEIYFSINASAAAASNTAEHKCSIDIVITPTGGQPLSAYSEIRATYTVIIPARTN